MTDRFKDRLGMAFLTVLKRHFAVSKNGDAIALSERLLEATELVYNFEHEDSGIAEVPVDLQEIGRQELPEVRFREPLDEPRSFPYKEQRAEVLAPPSPKNAVVPQRHPQNGEPPKSLLTLPGDPGFNETKPADLDKDKKKVISASAMRRPTRRPSNAPELPHWSEWDLSNELSKETPEDLVIEATDRQGTLRKITVSRNVHVQAGLGTVSLTYKHASVADSDGFLTAKHGFSVYDRELHITDAMDDIRAQLAGQYRAKPETMEPVAGPDPGPLRLDMRNQPGDYYESTLQAGAAMVQDPVATVKAGVRQDNDRLAPAGSRFR